MKLHVLILAVFPLFAIGGVAQAFQSEGGTEDSAGTPGVEDGTCWKTNNKTGHRISVKVKGSMHSHVDVTVTEGDQSGTGKGDPDKDGGCELSGEIKVGKETYKVEGGRMKWLNPAGNWVTMTKVKCKKDSDTQ